MELIAYDRKKLKNIGGYKKTDNMALIEKFAESDMDCVKVEGWTHKHATSCMNGLSSAIKRCEKSASIKAMVREGEVYLVKKLETK